MKKTRKIIAGIGTGIILLAGGSQIPVAQKPLTLEEWKSLTQTYDYEIKKQGGITIQNYTGDPSQLNSVIKNRNPTEQVTVSGKKMSASQYKVYRDNLLSRVEKKTLLNMLIK